MESRKILEESPGSLPAFFCTDYRGRCLKNVQKVPSKFTAFKPNRKKKDPIRVFCHLEPTVKLKAGEGNQVTRRTEAVNGRRNRQETRGAEQQKTFHPVWLKCQDSRSRGQRCRRKQPNNWRQNAAGLCARTNVTTCGAAVRTSGPGEQ